MSFFVTNRFEKIYNLHSKTLFIKKSPSGIFHQPSVCQLHVQMFRELDKSYLVSMWYLITHTGPEHASDCYST